MLCFRLITQGQNNYQLAFKSGATQGKAGGLLSSVSDGNTNEIIALHKEPKEGGSSFSILNYDGTFSKKFLIKSLSINDDNSFGTFIKMGDTYVIEGNGRKDASILIMDKSFKLLNRLKATYDSAFNSESIELTKRIAAVNQSNFLFYTQFNADAYTIFGMQSNGTTKWQKRYKFKLENAFENKPTFVELATHIIDGFISISTNGLQSYATKYSADGKVLLNKTINNFKAINSKISTEGNHFFFGKDQVTGKYAVLKLDPNLNYLYGKYLDDAEDLPLLYPDMLLLKSNEDVLIALPNNETNGIQLYKLSKDGSLDFARMIFDKQPISSTALFDLKDGTLLLKNSLSLLRRINENGITEDCPSIEMCHNLKAYLPQFGTFELEELQSDSLKKGDGLLITEVNDSTYQYCDKVALPSASFSLPLFEYCEGDNIVINDESIHPFGQSVWEFRTEDFSNIKAGKKGINFTMPNKDKATIIHNMIIGGCIYVDSMQLTRKNGNFKFLPPDTIVCENASLAISIDRNKISQLKWDDGDTSYFRIINEANYYQCSGVNELGCFSSDNLTLTHKKLPKLDLGFDNTLCIDSSFTINPVIKQDENIEWFDGSSANEYIVNGLSQVNATLTNECGSDQDTISFDYIDCRRSIVFPNIFSPNGDNREDLLIFKVDDALSVSVKIFDRRNKLMIQSESINTFSWDGTMNGCPVEIGVYTFIARIKLPYQIDIATYIGNFTLIR